jgi:hypothetical protein
MGRLGVTIFTRRSVNENNPVSHVKCHSLLVIKEPKESVHKASDGDFEKVSSATCQDGISQHPRTSDYVECSASGRGSVA